MNSSRRLFLQKSAFVLGAAALTSLSALTASTPVLAAPDNNSNKELSMNALVVYFSWSGNTALVAEQIASLTGAGLHRIVPVNAYPVDYNDCVEQAKGERQAEFRPELANRVDNMDQYSVVFFGYPNWWSSLPMPCWTFLESYNFAGKTIVPFCTHGGGGLANGPREIRQLASGAAILEAYQTRNAHSGRMPRDVESWLKRIAILA